MLPLNFGCPAGYCRGLAPKRICIAEKTLIDAGATGAWTKAAFMCAYCRCVYSVDGAVRHLHGFLENIFGGHRFSPMPGSDAARN